MDFMSNRYPILQQLNDTVNAYIVSFNDDLDGWSGITADFSNYGIGEVVVVSPVFVNLVAGKLKFWIGGLIWFLFIMYTVQRIAKLWGYGKG